MFLHRETEVWLGEYCNDIEGMEEAAKLHDFGTVSYAQKISYKNHWVVTIEFENSEVVSISYGREYEGDHIEPYEFVPFTEQNFFEEAGFSKFELDSIIAEAKIKYQQELSQCF